MRLLLASSLSDNLCLYFVVDGLICWFGGRESGKAVNWEYRDPDGKPHFVVCPAKWKWLYRFPGPQSSRVVREALWLQTQGWIFAVISLIFAIVAGCSPTSEFLKIFTIGIVGIDVAVSMAIMTPLEFRYSRNLQKVYDCDWVTQLQEALTMLPKRRCRIVEKIDDNTYIIAVGLTRKHFSARGSRDLPIKEKMYAVHYNERGYPFWEIRDH